MKFDIAHARYVDFTSPGHPQIPWPCTPATPNSSSGDPPVKLEAAPDSFVRQRNHPCVAMAWGSVVRALVAVLLIVQPGYHPALPHPWLPQIYVLQTPCPRIWRTDSAYLVMAHADLFDTCFQLEIAIWDPELSSVFVSLSGHWPQLPWSHCGYHGVWGLNTPLRRNELRFHEL